LPEPVQGVTVTGAWTSSVRIEVLSGLELVALLPKSALPVAEFGSFSPPVMPPIKKLPPWAAEIAARAAEFREMLTMVLLLASSVDTDLERMALFTSPNNSGRPLRA
jgi:hypothetical protein